MNVRIITTTEVTINIDYITAGNKMRREEDSNIYVHVTILKNYGSLLLENKLYITFDVHFYSSPEHHSYHNKYMSFIVLVIL